MRSSRILLPLACVAVVSLTGAANEPEKKDGGQDLLKVSLEVFDTQVGVSVGKPLSLKVVLHNAGDKPLFIHDWTERAHVIVLKMVTKGYPGQYDSYWGSPIHSSPACRVGGLRPLPPGDTVVERSVTPMIPGDVRIDVQVWCPDLSWSDPTGMERKAGWHGRARASLVVRVPAEMPEAMKGLYADYQRRLKDPRVAVADKMEILAKVAGEKHYFAARFIRDACNGFPAGSLKDSAIEHLARLARFGTAYESFPFLLNALADDKTPVEDRRALLDWIAQVAEAGWYQRLGGQVSYWYPDSLRTQALDTLNRLAKGRDPYLAAKAADILKTMREKKEK